MFARLFAERGLSLDRLRALVEVGAAGSIVKAAGGDPARQSLYSRQLKELEDFFRITLTERHGKGLRLTPSGKELARISRFFLLGLATFQRGCLAEGQSFRIGAGSTIIQLFLLPVLAEAAALRSRASYSLESVASDEVERRLHELTLDFGVVASAAISRPLQLAVAGEWRLQLWAPKALCASERQAARLFQEKRLPLVSPADEPLPFEHPALKGYAPRLTCPTFVEANAALRQQSVAALLPDFMNPGASTSGLLRVSIPALDAEVFNYRLAWNPRLLRLNPHASRVRDWLLKSLAERLRRGPAVNKADPA